MKQKHKKIGEMVKECIKNGVPPWQTPYFLNTCAPLRHNGTPFTGRNRVILLTAGAILGFSSPYWLTFAQAKKLGGFVRKGEKAQVYACLPIIKEPEEEGEEPIFCGWRWYPVFNADQIAGLDEKFFPKGKTTSTKAINPELCALFNKMKGKEWIEQPGCVPCFLPRKDIVKMPAPENFVSEGEYWAAMTHEFIHWTGHKDRLHRKHSFNTVDYAKEEMVAEIGAAIFLSDYGMTSELLTSHASYVKEYWEVLSNDENAFLTAVDEAVKAVDFLNKYLAERKQQTAA